MGGWRRRRRGIKDCPAPASCEPEAVGGAQHVFMSWRGPSSLFKKKLHKGGGGVKATQPGKSHKMAESY